MEYQQKDGFWYLVKDTMSGLMLSHRSSGVAFPVQSTRTVDYNWLAISDELDFTATKDVVKSKEAAIKFLTAR